MKHHDLSPMVVCAAPLGARHVQGHRAAFPLDADELAREAAACADAGATVLHLRVRDAEGCPSLDPELYRASLRTVCAEVGDRLVVQIAAEGAGAGGPSEAMALVRELRPEAASVALGQLAPGEADLAEAERFFGWAACSGVGLQYVVRTPEDAARLVELSLRGVLPDERPHALFVLGDEGEGELPTPHDLLPLLDAWPHEWPFTVGATGLVGGRCITAAAVLGGHGRVGFERAPAAPGGPPARRNVELVAHLCAHVSRRGRRRATVDEARALYGASGARSTPFRIVRAAGAAPLPLLALARAARYGRELH